MLRLAINPRTNPRTHVSPNQVLSIADRLQVPSCARCGSTEWPEKKCEDCKKYYCEDCVVEYDDVPVCLICAPGMIDRLNEDIREISRWRDALIAGAAAC